ncbi:MAG: FecR domain-containing protein [Opitutaceae bacterium]
MSNPEPASTDPIDAAAALWLARRDRGLSPAEQDAYLQWLHADPRNAEAVTRHAAALERMMQLYEWQPVHDTEPNPDLFLPRQSPAAKALAPARNRGWWMWSAGLTAAAAVAVVFLWGRLWLPEMTAVSAAPKSYLHVNERIALPDGSRIELKDGSRIVVQYSDSERRVRLTGGEAHFTVWKDKARPFIVEVAGVEVRAVGTAFNVRLDVSAVEVMVTEGTVGVERVDPSVLERPFTEPVHVSIGQRAVVVLGAAERSAPAITAVSNDEISRELAWQTPRLQFQETHLADAIAEFNRLNRHQLELGDPALGELRIGGTFRPDNVEGFVRLLGSTLDIRAESVGENRTVLLRAR